ncbi:MAG: hypothetical protein JNL12_20815 [Planctomycetes bacterium]|nr:hypothetical protein [Planctomycetota bacterium]
MRSFPSLLAAVLLAACAERAVLQSTDGRWRLLGEVDTTGAEAAARTRELLANAPSEAVVVAFAPAELPPRAASGGRRAVFVGTPAGGREVDADTIVQGAEGGDLAVELAVLHCHGIEVPRILPLGARVWTAATRQTGGTQRPGPGDVMLQMLRMRHREVLSGELRTDAVCRIGFVAVGSARSAGDAAAEAKKRFQHIELVPRVVSDAATLPAVLGELLDSGCRAVIVATPAALQLGELRTRAEALHALLLVLDPTLQTDADCVVGPDPDQLGRAAAEAVRLLVGDRGNLLELHPSTSPTAVRTRDAFHKALQLAPR